MLLLHTRRLEWSSTHVDLRVCIVSNIARVVGGRGGSAMVEVHQVSGRHDHSAGVVEAGERREVTASGGGVVASWWWCVDAAAARELACAGGGTSLARCSVASHHMSVRGDHSAGGLQSPPAHVGCVACGGRTQAAMSTQQGGLGGVKGGRRHEDGGASSACGAVAPPHQLSVRGDHPAGGPHGAPVPEGGMACDARAEAAMHAVRGGVGGAGSEPARTSGGASLTCGPVAPHQLSVRGDQPAGELQGVPAPVGGTACDGRTDAAARVLQGDGGGTTPATAILIAATHAAAGSSTTTAAAALSTSSVITTVPTATLTAVAVATTLVAALAPVSLAAVLAAAALAAAALTTTLDATALTTTLASATHITTPPSPPPRSPPPPSPPPPPPPPSPPSP